MHEVPRLVWFHVVDKRGHGRPIQTGHENAVEVLIGLTALESLAGGKVIGHDGAFLTVR